MQGTSGPARITMAFAPPSEPAPNEDTDATRLTPLLAQHAIEPAPGEEHWRYRHSWQNVVTAVSETLPGTAMAMFGMVQARHDPGDPKWIALAVVGVVAVGVHTALFYFWPHIRSERNWFDSFCCRLPHDHVERVERRRREQELQSIRTEP